MAWTEQEDETLQRLVDGRYTSGAAAKEMGKTRSAVMGRASRIGLIFRGLRDEHHCLRAKAPAMRPPPLPDSPEPPSSAAIPIWLLTDNTCRWPMWQHRDYPTVCSLYCGGSTAGNTYCSHHARRAHNDIVDEPPAS